MAAIHTPESSKCPAALGFLKHVKMREGPRIWQGVIL